MSKCIFLVFVLIKKREKEKIEKIENFVFGPVIAKFMSWDQVQMLLYVRILPQHSTMIDI